MFSLNRSASVTALADTAPLAAAGVAEGVRRKGAHQVAENRLQALRAQRESASNDLKRVISQAHFSEGEKLKKLRPLEVKLAELDEQLTEARLALIPLRTEHAERVNSALAQLRGEAADRIAKGLAELTAGVEAFNEVQDALRKVSADAPSLRLPPLDAIARVARGGY